jgi:hypothetical protein
VKGYARTGKTFYCFVPWEAIQFIIITWILSWKPLPNSMIHTNDSCIIIPQSLASKLYFSIMGMNTLQLQQQVSYI